MKKGFTLVEALVAISILIIGILSAFILVSRSLYTFPLIQDRLTASFLVQEGIELVRNIRDSNFIKKAKGENISWDSNLSYKCYTIEPVIGSSSNDISLNETNCECKNSTPLKFDDSRNFYNYQDGEETKFRRVIQIEKISNNEIKVTSTVCFKTKNIDFTVSAEDHLFNWLNF